MIFKNNQVSSRFKQVFHNTGFGIMIVDKNRDLIEVNPKFCEMLGYEPDELTFFFNYCFCVCSEFQAKIRHVVRP